MNSEKKMKEAQDFLLSDVKEEKINLKRILKNNANTSRISNKRDFLSSERNAAIDPISEKIKIKLI